MPYRIGPDCTACAICYAECPVDCITPGRMLFVIDEDRCIDCGSCAQSCPYQVIRVTLRPPKPKDRIQPVST